MNEKEPSDSVKSREYFQVVLACFGKHFQYGSSVKKEKRIGWMKKPFFSKTVEGSVLTVVQDVRSWADGFLFPARPPSQRCVFIWKRSVPAGGQVFSAQPT